MREVELINAYFADEQDGQGDGQEHEEQARRMLRQAESDVEQAEHDAAARGVSVLDQLAESVTDEDRLGAARKLVARKREQEAFEAFEAEGRDVSVHPDEDVG